VRDTKRQGAGDEGSIWTHGRRQHSAPKLRNTAHRRGEPLIKLGIMDNLSSIDELARVMCKDVYEATNGQPNEWKTIGGGASMRRAMIYAIARGWLLIDSRSFRGRVCLTDEGRREVRKSLS